MDEKLKPSRRVGIGNRSVDSASRQSDKLSAGTIMETWMTLGIMHERSSEVTPQALFQESINEAEALDSHQISTFHLSLPLEQQDEIMVANRPGLIGVHFAEYVLLRQRGLSHQDALVLAKEAARIRFGQPDLNKAISG